MIALVRRSFGRILGSFLTVMGVLAVFQIAVVASAAQLATSGQFESLARIVPAAMQPAIAPALVSFGRMTTLGYFDPLIVMMVVQWAIYVATEPAGEIETGLVDLILSRPLPRHKIVTRSLVVTVLSTTAIVAGMCASSFGSLLLLAPAGTAWPNTRMWMLMAAHLTVIAWCFGAFGLAAGCWTRRRGAAIAITAIGAVALWLLDFLGLLWPAAETIAHISPFYYFHGGPILAGTAHVLPDFVVLGSLAAAAAGLAYWRFDRRDL